MKKNEQMENEIKNLKEKVLKYKRKLIQLMNKNGDGNDESQ